MRACGCRAAMRWPPTVVCRRSHVCLLERVDTLIKVEDTVPSAHTLELQSAGCGAGGKQAWQDASLPWHCAAAVERSRACCTLCSPVTLLFCFLLV